MKISLFPQSRLGNWSMMLAVFCVLVLVLGYVLAEKLSLINSSDILQIAGISSVATAFLALVTAIVDLAKNKDWALLLLFPIITGLLVSGTIVFTLLADML